MIDQVVAEVFKEDPLVLGGQGHQVGGRTETIGSHEIVVGAVRIVIADPVAQLVIGLDVG